MKRLHNLLAFSSLALVCLAASPGLRPAQGQGFQRPPDDIGPNHRTWHFAAPDAAGSAGGGPLVELATGMNYFDPQLGAWVPSAPEFVPGADGNSFVADRVQQHVRLNANLNMVSAVTLTLADGIVVQATPVGIGLYSPETGQFSLIGSLTNCTGVPVEGTTNLVVYANPFSGPGLCCSLYFSIDQGSFSQDVVFTGSFDPRHYGFSTNALIQVITELYDPPEPEWQTSPLYVQTDPALRRSWASPDLLDTTLGFGELVFGPGYAYTMPVAGSPSEGRAPVAKAMVKSPDGLRTFLVESLPYWWLMKEFLALPACNPSGGQARLMPPVDRNAGYAALPRPPAKAAQPALVHTDSHSALPTPHSAFPPTAQPAVVYTDSHSALRTPHSPQGPSPPASVLTSSAMSEAP